MARQSTFSLYKKADTEGYLEKLGSGITSKLKAGRTKLWCELYGTHLHLFKENKNHGKLKHIVHRSSAGIQQIDMNQVHMVRKASADKSSTHFEILCKTKCQTFCASSVDECNTWIKHLQHAMTLKDPELAPPPHDTSSVTVGDYEIIDILPEGASEVPQFVLKQSSAPEADSGYTEVEFCNASSLTSVESSASDSNRIPTNPTQAKTQQLPQTEDEDSYSSVEVVMRNGTGQPVLQEIRETVDSATVGDNMEDGYAKKIKPKQEVNPSQPETVRMEAEGDKRKDEYAKVMKPKREANPSQLETVRMEAEGDNRKDEYAKVMKPKREANPSKLETARTEAEISEEDEYGYAKVNCRPEPPPRSQLPATPVAESENSEENSSEGLGTVGDGASDSTSDEDDVYVNIVSKDSLDPIPKFPHPLKLADTEPLTILQEFLSNNRKVCRRSFFDNTLGDDPIGDMKKLLLELQL